MIIANITTPLLGLVDTAVLGHLPSVEALAGASIGALVITQIYWVSGFLRMSVTGLSAQVKGAATTLTLPARNAYAKPLYQGAGLAMLLAILVAMAMQWLIPLAQWMAETDALTNQFIKEYLSVRVYGAPAALLNLVLVGWLVGQQQTRAVLVIQVLGNVLNILLNVIFVFGFELNVMGVAAATVCAEYAMLAMGAVLALRPLAARLPALHWFAPREWGAIVSLNTAMFVRNLTLQLCLAFITFQGAQLGAQTAAINAILMQFFVLIALGLDGIAYAVEALVGEAKGQKRSEQIHQHTTGGLIWSSAFALVYAALFFGVGEWVISLLTNKPELMDAASAFLPLMWFLPLIAHWCFLFDGVFVGFSDAKSMRNTMALSALGVFFPVWWLLQQHDNWALWWAFLAFLAARGFSLGWIYLDRWRKDHLLD
nr:MATE family efflux transporter [Alteromonas flava]